MSFEGGIIGTVISVTNLAWTTYKSCKAAPEGFRNISVEVASLHAVLQELGEILSGQSENLSSSREQRLEVISDGCQGVLGDLEKLVKKYESLGTQSKRTWDCLNWNADEIEELRGRLISNAGMLTAFLSLSQLAVEQKLNKLIADFQSGKHEGSILSVTTVDSLAQDEKETWRAIRKELEAIGISIEAFEINREFIMDWFQKSFSEGAFEEQNSSSEKDSISEKSLLASSTTPPQSQSPSTPENRSKTTNISIEPKEHELQTKAPASKTTPSILPTSTPKIGGPTEVLLERASKKVKVIQVRRPPRLATLFARLRGLNDDFIEACVDTHLTRAETLLQKGADVAATYTRTSKERCKQ